MSLVEQSARPTARIRTREEKQPDYTVRARSGRTWATIGAAWKSSDDRNVVVSMRINNIPIGFDGVLKVMLPLPPKEQQQEEQQPEE